MALHSYIARVVYLQIHSFFDEDTVYIMENTGHFPYFERPKELSKTLEDIISDIHV